MVGIWALVLLPYLLRKHESTNNRKQVDGFRTAMARLNTDKDVFQKHPAQPTVSAKQAIKSGIADPTRRRRLATRRRFFIGAVSTIPVSIVLVLKGFASPIYLLTPMIAFVLFVLWVRVSIARAKYTAQNVRRSAIGQPPLLRAKTSERSHMFAGLAAIRRAATKRLLATEPELDTATTESWQPAEVAATTTWSIPETIVPTYVTAPAATAIPRKIDVDNGEWGGSAMVAAAEIQRKQQLADLVAQVAEVELLPIQIALAFDQISDETTELQRVVGA